MFCFLPLNRTKTEKVTITDYLFSEKYVIFLVKHYKRCPICWIFAVIPMLSQRHLCRSK